MLKKTKTRESILKLLESSDTPLSANDIFDALKKNNITLSSIYRTLNTFHKEKLILKDNINGSAVYTLHREKHFHYLECNICHKKINLEYCPYHKVNDMIYKKLKFKVDEHNLVLFGTCDDCINKKS